MIKYLSLPALIFFSFAAQAQVQKPDSVKTVELTNVVVTASRLEEDLSKSPVSIEKLSNRMIYQSAAPSFFDALENIKGVQMLVPSVGFKVINTRGFGNTTNVRFVQMVDGMDNQAPHLGAPIANMLGPSDLDINTVEIIPGTTSALYGMNAINGLANLITKDPFTSQGISLQQKTGVNRIHVQGGAKIFSETSLRWAKAINSKLAFKINGTYTTGMDWIADDHHDLNGNANSSTGLFGADNPAADPVNSYGNESANRRTLALNGKNYVVARTGYYEKQVVDYSIHNLKGDAAIHYAFAPDKKLIYTYRFARLDNIYQRANRFRLEDYQLQQHGLAYRSKALQLTAYLNMENTGKSYNARSMAENIDKSFKSDDKWFADYTTGYNNAIAAGESVADAHRTARAYSDNGRPQPGTSQFNTLIKQLGDINNWDYGAALRVQSRMLHVEGQYNLTTSLLQSLRNTTGIELLTGFDHRTYIIIPDGNYFINPTESGANLLYSKTGGFIQASKTIREKLKVSATVRADKNEYYSLKWNPRFTAVYSPANQHHIRLSYQNGYRFPSVFEAFSNVNSGGVKRVGGLPVMSSGIFENAYKRASIDAFQAAVINDINKNDLSRNDAIIKNKNLLVKNDYTYVQPEQIRSIEVGYRALMLEEDLQVDVDFYYNRYNNFIAQVEMNIPQTSNQDSIPFYLNEKKKQDRYRMWTNSKTTAYNYGAGIGLRYTFFNSFRAMGNLTYAKLQRRSSGDGLEDGFNTPEWIVNFSVGNDRVYKNLGFMVTYRWQSNYYWQSFLVNGNVPAYQTVDAQITSHWKAVSVKIGGSNLFNHYYHSFLGGPAVGGFYYCTITYGL
ncbi:MAG TPA: TonB-dependent receptor [Ohtaekwangia sp.]|uniref:TonB-dependent receptor n=1 Tax=Ohtaekwangia sp. TaxID=2066019 RepID=UPI002F91E5DC